MAMSDDQLDNRNKQEGQKRKETSQSAPPDCFWFLRLMDHATP